MREFINFINSFYFMKRYILIFILAVSNISAFFAPNVEKRRSQVLDYLIKIKSEVDIINNLSELSDVESYMLRSDIRPEETGWITASIVSGVFAFLPIVPLLAFGAHTIEATRWGRTNRGIIKENAHILTGLSMTVGVLTGLSVLSWKLALKSTDNIPNLREKALSVAKIYDYCSKISDLIKHSPKSYGDIINTNILIDNINLFKSKSVIERRDVYIDGIRHTIEINCFGDSYIMLLRNASKIYHINKSYSIDYNEFYNKLVTSDMLKLNYF